MRVAAITCVKNEIDLVEAFVRHTCAFCKGRGSVMDRRSGVDRRNPGQAQPQPNPEADAQAQAQVSAAQQADQSTPAPAQTAPNPKAGE